MVFGIGICSFQLVFDIDTGMSSFQLVFGMDIDIRKELDIDIHIRIGIDTRKEFDIDIRKEFDIGKYKDRLSGQSLFEHNVQTTYSGLLPSFDLDHQ